MPYITQSSRPRGLCDAASGYVITISELVGNVISLAQSKSPIRTIPSDTRFSDTPVTDVQKAQRQLGFRASINIQKGLTLVITCRCG